MWVRPIFTERRLLQGASDNLLVEMRLGDPEKYLNYLRMSPIIFTELLNIVGPLIEKQHVVRQPIPTRTRLEVTIRWLVSGDSMTSLSYAYRIAQLSDAKNRFTFVDIAAEGRQSDGGVFENNGLPHLLKTNALHIPLLTLLNNMDLDFSYVLLGDEAFPLSTHMMRPSGTRLATLILTTVPIDHVEIDHIPIDHIDIDHVAINHSPE
ncbi:hypothetical protein X777_06944 [Ooceraea biroi]|uniref:Uncharacterized protein n=1 Tax=Ooceraea biroi TaxID=2015173 RepID=A0A026WCA0_OOCBI|nr:hypothetical protein X777_06944 [Ooceraea biroi]